MESTYEYGGISGADAIWNIYDKFLNYGSTPNTHLRTGILNHENPTHDQHL